jgi:hypothetical protein
MIPKRYIGRVRCFRHRMKILGRKDQAYGAARLGEVNGEGCQDTGRNTECAGGTAGGEGDRADRLRSMKVSQKSDSGEARWE